MIWPFRKRTPPAQPIPDRRIWNEDWQAGDIAECICSDWWNPMPSDPARGERYIVESVKEGIGDGQNGKVRIYALCLRGKPAETWYVTTAFRKVTPPAIERADEAFIADLNQRLNSQPVPIEVGHG